MKKQDKLSYGESRSDKSIKCEDINYLFMSPDCYGGYRIEANKAYFGNTDGVLPGQEFLGIAHNDEEVALVEIKYKGNGYDPMRVRPADARDEAVRKEWLEDAINELEWVKDEGYTHQVFDWNGLDPETVNPNEIELHTTVYKILERSDKASHSELVEEYWTSTSNNE